MARAFKLVTNDGPSTCNSGGACRLICCRGLGCHEVTQRILRRRMYWRETFLGRTGLIRSVACPLWTASTPQSIRHQQVISPSQWNYLAAPVVVSVPVVVPVRRT